MLHTVLRRRAAGEPVETIRTDLIIPAGKRLVAHASTIHQRPRRASLVA
jgi:hypothetical protein